MADSRKTERRQIRQRSFSTRKSRFWPIHSVSPVSTAFMSVSVLARVDFGRFGGRTATGRAGATFQYSQESILADSRIQNVADGLPDGFSTRKSRFWPILPTYHPRFLRNVVSVLARVDFGRFLNLGHYEEYDLMFQYSQESILADSTITQSIEPYSFCFSTRKSRFWPILAAQPAQTAIGNVSVLARVDFGRFLSMPCYVANV